jgi:prepilin-type N-terminal cleavage/methylation domain-containing protein
LAIDVVRRRILSNQPSTTTWVQGNGRHAFTLIEVLAAILILSILVVVSVPSAGLMIARAQEATCVANMRGITVGLHSYLQDHKNIWPQGPSPNEKKPWEDFWLDVLIPYDISEKKWQCPAFNSVLAGQGVPPKERPQVHYMPTVFPPEPGIATRWETQPWLIERPSVHKNGPHICFPDGSIKSFNKILAEQGVR